ncbi:hypothetical protein JCM21900_002953 [Sporobolomyces salmonicolor]
MAQSSSDVAVATFEDYVAHAAEAARICREAMLVRDPLLARVQELESELQVWKLGHQEAVKTAKDVQKQLDASDDLVCCFLDGDGAIFNRSYVQKGRDGGREAALALRQYIMAFAEANGVRGSPTVVVQLYVNKFGLSKVLQNNGIADEATFSNFLQGLNAAHPLIQVTDIGAQKEAADSKLKENLTLFAKLPSCKLVLAGCSHDGGYAHLFSTLETESPLAFSKVHLLHSYSAPAFELKRLNLRTTTFDGLFELKKLVSYAQVLPPMTPRKGSPAIASTGTGLAMPGGKTPRAVKKGSFAGKTATKDEDKENGPDGFTKVIKLRPIDPLKPLSKQNPPCCNQHYLAPPCHNAESCKYSHEYALTAKQLIQLRSDAKRSPCIWALKGKPCPPNCYAGHVCPHGKTCRYGGACRFSQPGMHPPGTKGRNDGWAWQGDEKTAGAAGHAGAGKEGGSTESGAVADEWEDEGSAFESTSSID